MIGDFHGKYLKWLASQVLPDHKPGKTYRGLFQLFHDMEFVWLTPNDDNRVVDALDLRDEFVYLWAHDMDFLDNGCSCFEVVIALSRRMAFMTGEVAEGWAWQLIKNLELDGMSDPLEQDNH